MARKVYIISLGYNNAAVMKAGIGRMYETMALKPEEFTHVILDQHYPIRRSEVLNLFDGFRKNYGATVMDAGSNLGLHHGWNWVCDRLPLEEEDVVIGYDPDSWPVQPGWDLAMVDALQHWKTTQCPWVSVTSEVVWHMPNARFEEWQLGRYKMLTPISHPCWVQSVCGFVWGPLKAVGNFVEPNPLYGDLEKTLAPKYAALGYKMAWMLDYHDEIRRLDGHEDAEYRNWKYATAILGEPQVPLEEWCEKKGILIT